MNGDQITLGIGVITFLGASLTWYDATVKKKFASERALAHLTNDYKALSANVAHLDRMLDERLDEIQREHDRINMLLQILATQSGGTAAQIFKKEL